MERYRGRSLQPVSTVGMVRDPSSSDLLSMLARVHCWQHWTQLVSFMVSIGKEGGSGLPAAVNMVRALMTDLVKAIGHQAPCRRHS